MNIDNLKTNNPGIDCAVLSTENDEGKTLARLLLSFRQGRAPAVVTKTSSGIEWIGQDGVPELLSIDIDSLDGITLLNELNEDGILVSEFNEETGVVANNWIAERQR